LDHAHHPVATSLRFLRPRPPPPSSTLFPYTTLFRSVIGLLNSGIACFYYLRLLAAVYTKAGTESARLNQVRPISVPAAVELGSGDRKSTRLNSSHLVISYAVFCLKKKKYYESHGNRATRANIPGRRDVSDFLPRSLINTHLPASTTRVSPAHTFPPNHLTGNACTH